MEKINIAELLKDCPKGMELDCTMWDNVVFWGINDYETYNICIKLQTSEEYYLTKYGCFNNLDNAKCVIFPKGKTTWEGFVPPCKFKDGDVIFVDSKESDEDFHYKYIAILKEIKGDKDLYVHGLYSYNNDIFSTHPYLCEITNSTIIKFATEKQKEKLFDAIKANGYKWNIETKTLEKLVEPKFKVGDRIKHKLEKFRDVRTITACGENGYWTSISDWIDYENQDDWELVSNKFDITTLKPFDKVLVRDCDKEKWNIDFFSYYRDSGDYQCMTFVKNQCIPYEGNEHLLGKTDVCDEFYKIWQ